MSPPHARTRLLLLAAPDRATLLRRLDRLHARLTRAIDRTPGRRTAAVAEIAGAAVGAIASVAGAGSRCEGTTARHEARERLAIVGPPERLAESVAIARKRLADFTRDRLSIRDRGIHFGCGGEPGRVAFLFPGEGAQRRDMLRGALGFLPQLREWFDVLDQASIAAGEMPPTRLIYPASDADYDPRRLFDIGYGGQLCTVANLALFEVVTALGISPDAVLGHSNGEHAAAMVGCMNVAAERARIARWLRRASSAGMALGEPPVPERMLAVGALREGALEAALAPSLERHAGRLFVAMENCPLQRVVGGTAEAIADAARAISAAGGLCANLPFERAYHTPLFAAWAGVLAAQYEALPLAAPQVPIYSCLTGHAMPGDAAGIRATMTRQWTEPVRLRTAIENLYADGFRCFVEIGPDDKLTAFVGDSLRGRPHLAVATASAQRDDLTQLQSMLAALYAQGIELDRRAARRLGRRPASYRASPRRHARGVGREALRSAQRTLLADARASLARMERAFAQRGLAAISPAVIRSTLPLSLAAQPFLADHALGHAPGLPVVSFTTSIALAVAAARAADVDKGSSAGVAPRGAIEIRAVEARSWLALDGGRLDLLVETRPAAATSVGTGGNAPAQLSPAMTGAGSRAIAVTLADAREGRPAFEALVAWPSSAADAAEAVPRLTANGGATPVRWTAEAFYRDYAFHGPSFHGLRRVTAVAGDAIEAELITTELPGLDVIGRDVDPALLDCAGQLVALWLLEVGQLPATVGVFPYAARRLWLAPSAAPGTLLRARGRVRFIDGVRTEADFEFTAGDHVVVRIEGLAQRVLRLPAAVARRVFRGVRANDTARDRSAAALRRERSDARDLHASRARDAAADRAADRAAWRDALTTGGGLFARVVAPQLLGDEALAAWRARPDIDVLVGELAIREDGGG